MWCKIKTFLVVILLIVLMPYKAAFAGPCVSLICIFKMILKATPGLPVVEFAAITPAIGRIPGIASKVVQEEFKSYLDDFQQKIQTGDFENISLPEAPKLSQLKNRFIVDESSSEMFEGLDREVDLNNPVEVGAAMEEMFTGRMRGSLEEVQHQTKMRKQMLEGATLNTLSKTALMQNEIETIRTQFDEVLEEISKAADENTATKSNIQAKALLAKVLAQMNEATAIKQTHNSYKELLYNPNPTDKPALASVAGVPGATQSDNVFATASVPAQKSNVDSVKLLKLISDARKKIQDAINAHNTMFSLYSNIETIEKHKRTILQHEEVLETMRAADTCAINSLSGFFKNPAEVWRGKDITNDNINDYTKRSGLSGWAINQYQARVSTAAYQQSTPPEFNSADELPVGEVSGYEGVSGGVGSGLDSMSLSVKGELNVDSMASDLGAGQNDTYNEADNEDLEAFARIPWEVGRDGLMNLYKNQAKWGQVSNYYPIWEDQKELYKQYWEDKYTRIQRYMKCAYGEEIFSGHSANMSSTPVYYRNFGVTDNIKYYRNRYNEVVSKHNQFMISIFGKAVTSEIARDLEKYENELSVTNNRLSQWQTAIVNEHAKLGLLRDAQRDVDYKTKVLQQKQRELEYATSRRTYFEQQLAAATTPEEIAAAQAALDTAQAVFTAAETARNNAQTALDAANAVVPNATSEYNASVSATAAAKSSYETAKTASDASYSRYMFGLSVKNNMGNPAYVEIEQIKNAKQNDLNSASNNETGRLTALTNAQTNVQNNQNLFNVANSELTAAVTAYTNASDADKATAATTCNNKLNAYNDALNNYNTSLTARDLAQKDYEYAQALKAYAQNHYDIAYNHYSGSESAYNNAVSGGVTYYSGMNYFLEELMNTYLQKEVIPPELRPLWCPSNLASFEHNFDPPVMPPEALPPFKEIVMLDDRDIFNNNLVPYPEMPEPWQKFFEINDGNKMYKEYSQVYTGGQFGQIYDKSGSSISFNLAKRTAHHPVTNAPYQTQDMMGSDDNQYHVYKVCAGAFNLNNPDGRNCLINNRIGKWLVLRNQEIEFNKLRQEAELALNYIQDLVRGELIKSGYTPPNNFDITKQADFDLAISRLASYKSETIDDVEGMLSGVNLNIPILNTRTSVVKSLINALKKDSYGLLNISDAIINVPNLDDKIAQAMADRSAIAQYSANAAKSEEGVVFDSACTLL